MVMNIYYDVLSNIRDGIISANKRNRFFDVKGILF